MAFPTIPTSGAGRILSTNNTAGGATKTFPNLSSLTKNAGDLLIAIAVIYDGNSTNAEFSSWGGGFNEVADRAGTTTMAIGVAYKWSTGSETGTFTVTTADTSTNDSVMILLSIPGAHASTPPEVGAMTTGTTAAANVAALNPGAWDVEDTLWIAVGGAGETSTTGSFTGVTASPTNYGSDFVTSITADVVGGVNACIGFRQLAAASDDPATFTTDTSNARNANLLIAVRPAPAPNQGSASGAITWAGTANGITTRSGAGSGSIAWVGSSTGTRVPKGSSTGAISWAGSATGETPILQPNEGAATGSITWAGSALGTTARSGAATGAIAWSGVADGETSHSGAGTGGISWTGAADGLIDVEGAASGNITWVGSANGAAPSLGPKEGSAAGAITWTGSANGETPPVPMHEGAAVGAVTWVGVATGQIPTQGPWWFRNLAAFTPTGGYERATPGYVKRVPEHNGGE